MNLKQIVLDTETTGINKYGKNYINHKIIEIGAIEIIDEKITENRFHKYIKPNRIIDYEAYKIHGINNNFLKDKPCFIDIVDEFIEFIKDSELIIHNSKFDVDFINYELRTINYKISDIKNICSIKDSLSIAKKKFPGKKNNLDALCIRYNIDNSNRKLHGAMIDAELLSKVFLFLNKTQIKIPLNSNNKNIKSNLLKNDIYTKLFVLKANNKELKKHKEITNFIKIKYINK